MLNGIIKITRRSICQFQFGDNEPVIKLDIIEVSDMWHEINFSLRELKDDMWIIPPGKMNEFAINRLNFVQQIVASAYPPEAPVPTLSRIEAEEFIRQVTQEAENLRNFSLPKGEEISSAPENTVEDKTFSQ